jgi:hypothetical protein
VAELVAIAAKIARMSITKKQEIGLDTIQMKWLTYMCDLNAICNEIDG